MSTIPITPFLLAGILLLAFVLRTHFLSEESAWYDEIASVQYLNFRSLGPYLRATAVANQPVQPLYFVVLYYWSAFFGAGESAARVLSILVGMGSIFLLYLIARKLAGDGAGLIAALLMATNHEHVRVSQEIRMYALLVFLVLLSLYTFLQVLSTDRRSWWIAHIVTTVAMVWTHAFAAFALPAEGLIYMAYGPRNLKKQVRWFVLQFLACLTLVPWLVGADFATIDKQMAWLPLPTFSYPLRGIERSSGSWVYDVENSEFVGYAFQLLCGISLLGVGVKAILSRGRSIPGESPAMQPAFLGWLCLLWFCLPSLLLFVISYAWRPCYHWRYIFYSFVAMFLLVGVQYALMRNRTAKGLFLGIVVGLAMLQSHLAVVKPWRPPWHGVRQAMEERRGKALDLRVVTGSQNDTGMAILEVQYHMKGLHYSKKFFDDVDSLIASLTPGTEDGGDLVVIFRSVPAAAAQFEEFLARSDWSYEESYLDAMRPMSVFTIKERNPENRTGTLPDATTP